MALVTSQVSSQYTLYKEVDGVQFYTKWGHEKWWSRKSDKVLLVKVVNTTDTPMTYSLGVEFFKDLKMVEQSQPGTYCVKAGGKVMPRSKGLMVKPAVVYDTIELTGLDVEKVDACEP